MILFRQRFSQRPVNMDEIQNLRCRRNDPGARIQKVQGLNGMEVGKDGVNPDNTENAGAHDHNNGGNDGLAQASGGGNGAVHESRYAVGKRHHRQTLQPGVHYGRITGKEPQELIAEHIQPYAQHQPHEKGVGQGNKIAVQDPLFFLCTKILGHEAGTAGVEGGHHVID